MQFSRVLPVLFAEFQKKQIDFALVGGLALYFSGAARTTFDADFMIFLTQADAVDRLMKGLGYDCLHKTENVANYASKDPAFGQVDFLFAHRPYALAMLSRAVEREFMNVTVKVLQPEDLIGLKVQSSSNQPERLTQDMLDVENLLKGHARTLDWELIETYFRLFDREKEFKNLRRKYQ